MVLYKARDGYYVAMAGGTDLTAIDNAQAAIIVGELKAVDKFIDADITHTKPLTTEINPSTASHYPDRIESGRIQGEITTRHYLQTGILTHKVLGACSTGAGPPYTKTITKKTTTIPHFFALHYEKEGTNASRRKDCLLIVPRQAEISVSERDSIAKQLYRGSFGFTGAGGDLVQPTPFTNANLPPYTWFNYKNASGASEFKYNGGVIDVDIVDIKMRFGWKDVLLGPFDGVGYPTDGVVVPPFMGEIELGVRIIDGSNTSIYDISDLLPSSYAGDLDFIADFYIGANAYLKFVWDKMFLEPKTFVEVFQGEDSWYDGARFILRFKDKNSSLAVEEKDLLDKTSFEND